MEKKFRQRSNFNLHEVNQEVLAEWLKDNLFETSIRERKGAPSFVFFEGPPSANGMPGIHHVMARTIKDIICRYKTMRGYEVKRKAGWDTHGLPVELGVEKSLGITKEDIGRKISVDDYNAACRREVMKYTREWESLTSQMGYWVDMNDPYITYDNRYIESVWWLLKQLHDKGLLYKGYTIQPYSPAAGTGLSTHELNQPGCYRDVKDTTCTAIFRAIDTKPEMEGWGEAAFVAWTTTPWTLPSNTALCVGLKIDYSIVRTFNPYTAQPLTLVMATERVNAYFKPEGAEAEMVYTQGDKLVPYRIVGSYKGQELEGMRYEQLMPWVKPCEKLGATTPGFVQDYAAAKPQHVFGVGTDSYVELEELAFRVITGDYVTTEDGTGIVHIAPTFGADDARVAKAAGIPSLFMINKRGETRPMVDFTGKYYTLGDCAEPFVEKCVNTTLYNVHAGNYVKNAYDPRFNTGGKYNEQEASKAEDLNVTLSIELKQEGRALKVEKHVHNYPHCWRTDKPVLYYPLDSWFIRSTAVKEKLIEHNKSIKWKPASTGTGRFGKWLENLQDWNLSRSRYWGTPLPIWRTEDGTQEKCIQSVEELFDEIDRSVAAGNMTSNPYRDRGFVPGDYSKENYEKIDLHRPYVDDIVLTAPDGRPMRRETDLIDVWFDSGSMPFAQQHYPFEHKEEIDNNSLFPADFIAEGVDQTRGWFFTLHAIAAMVKDSVAYKAVISNGLVLDKDGNKMSKRLGNAVNPFETIAEFGADPVRWYMISNSAPWDNLKFDKEGVRETARKMFATLFNTYSFFAGYANVDDFDPQSAAITVAERPEIDRWILSLLNSLIKEVTEALDDYEPTKAARAIATFVNDHLSNWYVRLNRKRFWGKEMDADKLAAYQTLYTCLDTVARLIAPFAPFYAHRLYGDLHPEGTRSVHLELFPTPDASLIDPGLEMRMMLAQTVTSMVLALRRKADLKVRQPLQQIMIPPVDNVQRQALEAIKSLILNEVNVKELKFVDPDAGILVKRIRPDFKKLGAKHGKLMKQVAAAINAMPQNLIAQLEKEGTIALQAGDHTVDILLDEVTIVSEDIPGWLVANEGNVTVALDITVTPQLRAEGIARELINRIQNLRKGRDYEITDRIDVVIEPSALVTDALTLHTDYIASQVLAASLTAAPVEAPLEDEILDIDGQQVRIKVTKH